MRVYAKLNKQASEQAAKQAWFIVNHIVASHRARCQSNASLFKKNNSTLKTSSKITILEDTARVNSRQSSRCQVRTRSAKYLPESHKFRRRPWITHIMRRARIGKHIVMENAIVYTV